MNNNLSVTTHPFVQRWLLLMIAIIILMMAVGAITRLTESGLSIVEWNPVMGFIPPLNQEEWQRIFILYQQTSQYQIANQGMNIDQFKEIFWWEYIHRVIGRLIGIFYLLPFLYFLIKKQIPTTYLPRLWLLFFLGGLQGFIGWWMVKSGFVNRTEVSQIRLMIHLDLALIILSLLVWTYFDLTKTHIVKNHYQPSDSKGIKDYCWAFLPMVMTFITISAGALTAGSNAGFIYNEWPLMDGEWFPDVYWDDQLGWHSMIEDLATIQMNHRLLAYLTFIIVIFTGLYSQKRIKIGKCLPYQQGAGMILIAIFIQIILGVFTLLMIVPIWLATLHQIMAALVLIATLRHAHRVMTA